MVAEEGGLLPPVVAGPGAEVEGVQSAGALGYVAAVPSCAEAGSGLA